MAPSKSRKALEPKLGHDSIEDYEYQQNGSSNGGGASHPGMTGTGGKAQHRLSQPSTAKASFNPINSARTSLLNVLSGAKSNLKKKADRGTGENDYTDVKKRRLSEAADTPAGEVIRNYLLNTSSSSSFISASSASSGSTNASSSGGTSGLSKDGLLLTPTTSMIASPLSSPELSRNRSNSTATKKSGTASSRLASSLGHAMSQPLSTFNRFDEIDIAPHELSDNLISILERPLGLAAQRAYANSMGNSHSTAVNGGGKAGLPYVGSRAQEGGMVTMLTGPSVNGGGGAPGMMASQTGTLMGGKSGAKHEEYGFCMNQNWRYTSQYDPKAREAEELQPPYYVLLTTYFSYLVMICLGHIRDFCGKRLYPQSYSHLKPSNGYAALNSDFDSFYTRRLKARMDDCFSRPVTGVAGRTIMTLDRVSDDFNENFNFTGTRRRALNISSYNYLGFAQATGGVADAVEAGLKRYGVSSGGTRLEAGTLDLHVQVEKLVSQFVGTEDAMIVSMGFATNSTTIPALVDKGCLVISDELNHASIRFGVRLSAASIRVFKHNDMRALETLLREAISQGQPRTHRPWKKILVIVEGLYSMEGSLIHLPELIVLKEKYKFYLYVDEAHSIGALGPNGRGVCDYFGVDPRSVDLLMGTFTKSFGAAGGYIAGSKEVIDRLRIRSHAMAYAEAMSPLVMTQIMASMGSIMGVSPPLASAIPPTIHVPYLDATNRSVSESVLNMTETQMAHVPGPAVYGPAPASTLPMWLQLSPSLLNGTEGRERLRRLAFNSRYLSGALRKMGFIVYGHRDSPIVPMLLYNPAKMPMFSRMMLDRFGKDKTPIVVVVVAYPATPLISSRVRFCLSAAHTKHDIDVVLRACDEIGLVLDLKHGDKKDRWSAEECIRRAEEIVFTN
ncbi:hypothetical protein QFC22_006363 [Naganishia vaughanmartiniae]|uniref:Uncharacterized protein n=1 Tax=Naganishia vaughanmartiniae TaxID=1424756 RepID=A0ACC2WNE3_9TREE|nr:hypothetical protein QFC22_006363 [Naganishia vaughanmartiniae]